MTERFKKRKPLRQRAKPTATIYVNQFSDDTIVWKGDLHGVTYIPDHLKDDPFISSLVKYFNSRYFRAEVDAQDYIGRYKAAVTFLLEVLCREEITRVPENIFAIYLSHLKDEDGFSERKVYRFYNCIRSFARKVTSVAIKNKKPANLKKLREIPITTEERSFLIYANKLAPNVYGPTANPQKDLIESLGLEDKDWVDGEKLIQSIRAFSAFFIIEWAAIRDNIYEKFPRDVIDFTKHALVTIKPGSNVKGFLGGTTNNPTKKLKSNSVDKCFEITSEINHPFLTELFVYQYLGIKNSYGQVSDFLKNKWDFETVTSTSSEVDWLKKIPEIYSSTLTENLARTDNATSALIRRGHSKNYPNLNPDWSTSPSVCFSVKQLLGQSISEQTCMSWIFATDRHQSSNQRWMNLGDISITDNSVNTIIQPHSLKRRAMKTSGVSYSKNSLDQLVFDSSAGQEYKRNQEVFRAIINYKNQLVRASKSGVLTGTPYRGNANDLWFFSQIRSGEHTKGKSGYIQSRFMKFLPTFYDTLELLLCSMEGSLSNQFVIKNCPEAAMFLKVIQHACRLSDMHRRVVEKGVGIGISEIARLAVNNNNQKIYSVTNTPPSNNYKAELSEKYQIAEIARDAALHNHSVSVKANIYADKLPSYILKKANFGARVGDEFVRMAGELGEVAIGKTSVMTMPELRKKLGIDTTSERELEQVNELMEQMELEGFVIDELGLAKDSEGKVVIIRHPISIKIIQASIDSIDKQLNSLAFSDEQRVNKAVIKYMYLKMILTEKFTPSEIRQADQLYGDVTIPMSDILV